MKMQINFTFQCHVVGFLLQNHMRDFSFCVCVRAWKSERR